MASAAEEGDRGSVASWRGKICWLRARRRCSLWLRRRRPDVWLAESGALVLGGLGRERERFWWGAAVEDERVCKDGGNDSVGGGRNRWPRGRGGMDGFWEMGSLRERRWNRPEEGGGCFGKGWGLCFVFGQGGGGLVLLAKKDGETERDGRGRLGKKRLLWSKGQRKMRAELGGQERTVMGKKKGKWRLFCLWWELEERNPQKPRRGGRVFYRDQGILLGFLCVALSSFKIVLPCKFYSPSFCVL